MSARDQARDLWCQWCTDHGRFVSFDEWRKYTLPVETAKVLQEAAAEIQGEGAPHYLMVPSLGTTLILVKPWTFTLHVERRNSTFALNIGQPWYDHSGQPSKSFWGWEHGMVMHGRVMGSPDPRNVRRVVTFPAGTKLKVARVYIRGTSNDAREFDSLTFTVVKVPGQKWKGRFWAKLAEVNHMECVFVKDTMPGFRDTDTMPVASTTP